MKKIIILLFIVFLFSSCQREVKQFYKNNDIAFGPRNGDNRGEIIFSFDPKNYKIPVDEIKNVYIISPLINNMSFYANGKIHGKRYKVRLKKGGGQLIFPLLLEKSSDNEIFRAKITLPDGIFQYYFNVSLKKNIKSDSMKRVFFQDINNRGVYTGFTHSSAIKILNGRLNDRYDKKLIRYLRKNDKNIYLFNPNEIIVPVEKEIIE